MIGASDRETFQVLAGLACVCHICTRKHDQVMKYVYERNLQVQHALQLVFLRRHFTLSAPDLRVGAALSPQHSDISLREEEVTFGQSSTQLLRPNAKPEWAVGTGQLSWPGPGPKTK